MSDIDPLKAEGYVTEDGLLTSEGARALANGDGPFAPRFFDPETGEELEVIASGGSWSMLCLEHGWQHGTGRMPASCPKCDPDPTPDFPPEEAA